MNAQCGLPECTYDQGQCTNPECDKYYDGTSEKRAIKPVTAGAQLPMWDRLHDDFQYYLK